MKKQWQRFQCWLNHDWHWVMARYAGFNHRSVTSQCSRCGVCKREILRAETLFYAGFSLTYHWDTSPYDHVPLLADSHYWPPSR